MAKIVETIVLKEPNKLSIVNDIWGNTIALGLSGGVVSHSSLGFKYVSQVVVKDISLEENGLGLFSYPPRPADQSGFQLGYGAFSPSNLLRSYMWNSPANFLVTSVAESPSTTIDNLKTPHIQYDITYGFVFNPNLECKAIEVSLPGGGNFLGFTFSADIPNFFISESLIYVLSTNPLISGSHTIYGSTTSNFITTYTAFTSSMTLGTNVALITSYNQNDGVLYNLTGYDGTLDYMKWNQNVYNNTDRLLVKEIISGSSSQKFLSNYNNGKIIPSWQYTDFEGNYELINLCRKIPTFPNATWQTISFFIDVATLFDEDIRGVFCLYDKDSIAQASNPVYLNILASVSPSRIRCDFPIGSLNLDEMGWWNTNSKYLAIWLESYTTGEIYSEVRFFELYNECSLYTPVTFMYVNRFGAFEYTTFTQDKKQVDSISRTEYKQEINWGEMTGDNAYGTSPILGLRGRNILSQKISETYTANSNWLSEEEYSVLSELVESPDVYIILDGETTQENLILPIVITDTTYDFKTSFRDGIFNLTINYKLSNDRMSQRQ